MASKKDPDKHDTSKKDGSKKGGRESSSVAPSDTAYRVLARKYRPQTFEDAFIGQAAMVRTLANAFSAGRIAHAFMLTGVRGIGKTTTARIIAKGLNCIGADGTNTVPTVSPCGICDPCRSVADSRSVDVLEMDAASRTGIEDIREIIDGVRYAPAHCRYKVYIIDEVHMLSKNAFNGLLKTLEEPPPHVKFIFATTEVRKVPITVLSRCQRFDLKRVPADDLARHLGSICEQEKQKASEDALRLIARVAEGSVRDALSLLDQAFALAGDTTIEEEPVRIMLGLADRSRGLELFDQLMRGAIGDALLEFRNQYDSGADPLAVLQDLSQICHEISRLKVCGGDEVPGFAADASQRMAQLAGKLAMPQLARTWQLLLKALSEVQSAPDGAAAAEMALIRIAYAAELPPSDQLVRVIGGAGGSVSSPAKSTSSISAPPPPAPSLRMNAAQNEVRAQIPPAPRAELASSAGLVDIPDFKALAELAREKREMRLLFALENHVHVISFERGRIEMRLEPAANRAFSGELIERLHQWTGERWIVSVSGVAGEPTLAEQRAAEDLARRASAAQDPLLKAALAMFPGAKVVAVRDRDEFAEGETGEGS